MGVYWATGAILLPYLVLAWFLGIWLHLQGSNLWILRGGLALLGLIAAAAFFFFYRKAKAEDEPPSEEPEEEDSDTQDVDILVHDAVRKLRGSALGRSASLGKLPLVFVLGESASAKTHTVVNSSLDPELLAGHVYQDNQILPTATANFWYTKSAVFADLAGGVLRENKKFARLIRLLQPGRVSSAMQSGRQAPRAVIVCFDCGRFLEERASESVTAAARQLHSRLQQISQLLGISFPVYVVFTKVDRIPFFPEYVRNFSKDEGNTVLGATLPVRPAHSGGVYADEETRRLEKAFDELFYSLADRRIELLGREHEAEKRPLVYEFPRELKKIRKLLVNFLVDLARPSQLQVNPFLRGFYFSGVRPIVIDDVAAATPNEYVPPAEADAGATRIFSAGQVRGPQAVAQRVVGSRKVPQWLFLSQFFNGVLLKDQVAFRASGFSTRVSFLRRTALAGLALLGLVCVVFLFVSFLENRALENEVMSAAREVPALHLTGGQLASASDLQHLDRLRSVVARLSSYETDGPPWHMRWGLYVGDVLYPEARRVYFQHFREMLFQQTQGNIIEALRALPNEPAANTPNDAYEKSYGELKAYLITTGIPDKSTVDFLSPVLLSHWTNGHDVDPERADLAHKQFDFYSSELPKKDPFSIPGDGHLITQAREYLNHFQGIERIYRALITEADKHAPSVSFNEQFKDTASVVVSNYKVRGAFTQAGADFMKEALRQPNRYVGGETWVVGPIADKLDQATLEQKLADRYTQDYVGEWRNVLERAEVRNYASLSDAETKLEKLTSPTSPLLQFLAFVSQNTNVDISSIRDVFQPAATVVPPTPPDKYRSPSNDEYISALSNLQIAINTLQKSPTTDASATKPLFDAAADGRKAVSKYQGKFHVDQDTKAPVHESVPRLLLKPIDDAEALAGRASTEAVNGAGKGFCKQFTSLLGKFPFNPHGTEELTVAQMNEVLAPKTGALWTFYSSTLSSMIVPQGPVYVPAPNAKVSSRFMDFFRRAASLSDTLYPGGSATPRFAYTVSPLPSNVEVALKIGAETLAQSNPAKNFAWTGNGNEDIDVVTKNGESLGVGETGTWAIFHFVDNALGTWPDLEWVLQTNGRPQKLPDGRIKSFKYHFQVNGFNPLKVGELSRLQCVSQVLP